VQTLFVPVLADGSAPQCLIDRVSEEIPDSDLRDGASPAEDSISQEDSTSKEGSGGEEGRSGTAAGPGSSFTEEEGTEGRGSGAAVGTGSSFTEEEGTEGGGPDATGGKDKEVGGHVRGIALGSNIFGCLGG